MRDKKKEKEMVETVSYKELVRYRRVTDAELTRLYLKFEDIPFKVLKRDSAGTGHPRDEVIFKVPSHALESAQALLAQYQKTRGVPFN